jgi:hypothetical protein
MNISNKKNKMFFMKDTKLPMPQTAALEQTAITTAVYRASYARVKQGYEEH